MKKAKRLTKKERRALAPVPAKNESAPHIHCVACGRHIDPDDFTRSPIRANWLRCAHGTKYASCSGCVAPSMRRLSDHDRTGDPVQVATAWH